MLFVFTGPESSGKTTLSDYVCSTFGLAKVDELARIYLERKISYLPNDLLKIAQYQHDAENTAVYNATNSVVADTDLQTIYLWWQEKFGPVPNVLADAFALQTPRVYLLCKPDIAWVRDPLRENPRDRKRLFDVYEKDLRLRQLPYEVIDGDEDERLIKAGKMVSRYLAAK